MDFSNTVLWFGTLIVIVFLMFQQVSLGSLQDDILRATNSSNITDNRILSRKRRFLVFPEGSSLQLVFCLTIPSIGVGSIFTIGSTAALAWELPHDPFVPFRKPAEVLHRIDENAGKPTSGGWTTMEKISNHLSSALGTQWKNGYNPFLAMNKPPAMSYSTVNDLWRRPSVTYTTIEGGNSNQNSYYKNEGSWRSATDGQRKSNYNNNAREQGTVGNTGYKTPYSKYDYGNQRVYNEPVTTYLHPIHHQVYRRTRRDLYSKIEKLFTTLSRDGKTCLLKSICEVSQAAQYRGTFMEEIIKTIFRVRHREDDSQIDEDHYDLAANEKHNCTEMYSNCPHSIWNGLI